jgi:hypothetical protein
MAFTDHSDLFASIHEAAFNNVVLHLQRQRPSLFNYGTISFVKRPELLCNQAIVRMVDPEVRAFGNPIVKEQPLLAIPGYNGPYGLEYCLQLAELSIDFHPGNLHALPPQLTPPLATQRVSLKARACAGLNCPPLDLLIKLAPDERPYFPIVPTGTDFIRQEKPPRDRPEKDEPIVVRSPTTPFPFNREVMLCFCLDLFAVLHVERVGSGKQTAVALRLDNLEIVDVTPAGLEDSVECFLKAMLVMGVLPKVKLALEALIFKVGDVLTIGPTPVSTQVPFNPAIEQDQIKVFVSLTV